MYRTDDPHRDFLRHEDKREKELAKLPKCKYCGNPIQDEYAFVFNGKFICEECLDNYHRINIGDYID